MDEYVWVVLWHGSLATRVFRQKPSDEDLCEHFGTILFDQFATHQIRNTTWYDLNGVTLFSITREKVY